jgi:site-specific DNA-cytosine methylase
MAKRISVIGLFSGAGGVEVGAAAAGADVRLSIDNDRVWIKPLLSSTPRRILCLS